MNDTIGPNKKFKIELQTAIIIVSFVFSLGLAWGTLSAKQTTIIEKLDTLAVQQQEMINVRDAQHTDINQKFAWAIPMLHTVAEKLGLE